jgi:CheY-like chemotaxis protein
MAQRTVLLCDDCLDTVELVKIAFHRAGFWIVLQSVSQGEEAVRYLQGAGKYAQRERFPFPSLVLLNTRLIGMSGLDVLRWIRSRAQFNDLVVIVFTGSDFPEDMKQAIELGASGFETKPQQFSDFVGVVKKLGDTWLAAD